MFCECSLFGVQEGGSKGRGNWRARRIKERIKTPEGKGTQKREQGGGEGGGGRGETDTGIPDKEV